MQKVWSTVGVVVWRPSKTMKSSCSDEPLSSAHGFRSILAISDHHWSLIHCVCWHEQATWWNMFTVRTLQRGHTFHWSFVPCIVIDYSVHIHLHKEMSWLFSGDFQIELDSEYSTMHWKSRRSWSVNILFRRLLVCTVHTDTQTIFFQAYFFGKCPFSRHLDRKDKNSYLASSCNTSEINPYCALGSFSGCEKSLSRNIFLGNVSQFNRPNGKKKEFEGVDFWVYRKNNLQWLAYIWPASFLKFQCVLTDEMLEWIKPLQILTRDTIPEFTTIQYRRKNSTFVQMWDGHWVQVRWA